MSRTAKNKTLAAWIATIGGTFGLHRFYLRGFGDWIGWLYPLPTALGLWGFERMNTLGQDDQLAWMLMPFLGLTLAASCLTAIVYALAERQKWNRQYNPTLDPESTAGATSWATIGAIAVALLAGAVALMSTIAFSIQRYYEMEVEAGRAMSQSQD